MGGGFDRDKQLRRDVLIEQRAEEALVQIADEHGDSLRLLWSRGDGMGGGVLDRLAQLLGLPTPRDLRPAAPRYRKAVISADLRRDVFERDAYRCVMCSGFVDLTCGHCIPEVHGGPTTLANLQTMCRSCNSRKGSRSPA